MGSSPSEKITVYSAENSAHRLGVHFRALLSELPQAHELGLRLFKRNIKAMYRQSMLGFFWALIPPLVTALLWIVLRGNGIMEIADTQIAYPVFVLTGTLLWQMFSEALLSPLASVNSNRSMLAKINIPREGLLLSGIYELAFNWLIKAALIGVVLAYFNQQVNPIGLLMAIGGSLLIMLVGYSIGLLLTPLGMLFADIGRGIGIVMPFLMYLTPVIYPYPRSGTLASLMPFNPVATILTYTRDWLTAQTLDIPWAILLFFLAFLLLTVLGILVYRIAMPMIIERIGS